jgi:hypothetical protein
MRPVPGYYGLGFSHFGLPNGGSSNPMPIRPGFLGGNNGGSNGLASTINSLPPQIESLTSAFQNINDLAQQLQSGIASLMGSLGGNESMNNNTSTQPKLNRVPFGAGPAGGINNLLDPRVINNRHLGASNISYFGNPLQTQLGGLV